MMKYSFLFLCIFFFSCDSSSIGQSQEKPKIEFDKNNASRIFFSKYAHFFPADNVRNRSLTFAIKEFYEHSGDSLIFGLYLECDIYPEELFLSLEIPESGSFYFEIDNEEVTIKKVERGEFYQLLKAIDWQGQRPELILKDFDFRASHSPIRHDVYGRFRENHNVYFYFLENHNEYLMMGSGFNRQYYLLKYMINEMHSYKK